MLYKNIFDEIQEEPETLSVSHARPCRSAKTTSTSEDEHASLCPLMAIMCTCIVCTWSGSPITCTILQIPCAHMKCLSLDKQVLYPTLVCY